MKCSHCNKEIENCINAECIDSFARLETRLDNIKEGQDEIKTKIGKYEGKVFGALWLAVLSLATAIGSIFMRKL